MAGRNDLARRLARKVARRARLDNEIRILRARLARLRPRGRARRAPPEAPW